VKIAFILDAFPKLSETFILNQITGLIDRGQEVDIYAGTGYRSCVHEDVHRYRLLDRCRYFPEPPKNRWPRYLKYLRLLLRLLLTGQFPLTRLFRAAIARKLKPALAALYRGSPLLCRNAYDIIQCHYGTNGNLAVELKAFGLKGKIVTMFHGYDLRLAQSGPPDRYKPLFSAGDCFLAISDHSRSRLLRLGAAPEKIVYHPVGIDLDRFKFSWHGPDKTLSPPFRMITVARLTREKGLGCGLEAFSLLLNDHPELSVEYRILGDGPLEKDLKKQCADLQLTPYVKFLGSGSQETVIREMARAHLFFLPSIEEVLPVVLMEALALGLPCVAADTGSIAQVLTDQVSGYIAGKASSVDLADKLYRLISRPQSWREMGTAGRHHIETHYNIHHLNDQLLDLYAKLFSGSRPAAR